MAKKTYIAQNSISGLAKTEIKEGDAVELDEKDAAEFVKGGSLKLEEPKKSKNADAAEDK